MKQAILVANNRLAKIQLMDHEMKKLPKIIEETHIDKDVNDRLLQIQDRIDKLEHLFPPRKSFLTAKHEPGHSIVGKPQSAKQF